MEQQTVVSDAQPAGSSPAPVRAEAVHDSLSHEEKQSWQKTGALPDRITITKDGKADSSPETDDAGSSPATPARPAASTDASLRPASEPGKGTDKGKGAQARNAELDAEITGLQERLKLRRALREELAALERPAQTKEPPASSPGKPTTQAEWTRYAAMPDAPKEEDFQTVRDYTIAMTVFVAEKRDAERAVQARHSEALTRHTEQVKQTVESAKGRIEQYRQIEPDLEQKIDPQLVDIVPASLVPRGQPIGAHHALMENILRSDFTPQLLIHFSTPDGKAEWRSLCELGSRSPDAFLRAFGRVEARIEQSAQSASAPVTKRSSSAPTPPVVLGSRPADTADPVEAAVKRKDVSGYIREMNKRELAALRG